MTLLKMSFSGALLIMVVVILRALFINKLPKKMFMVLWGIVLLRLLVPFSVSSPFSVYSLMTQNKGEEQLTEENAADFYESDPGSYIETADESIEHDITRLIPAEFSQQVTVGGEEASPAESGRGFSIWFLIWGIGTGGLGIFFTAAYLRCSREFKTSLPVDNAYTKDWLKEHSLKRTVEIRQSDLIRTPLTYGLFHPVILMPQKTDWEEPKGLQYVLMHEYVHICHFDGVWKLIGTAALCIHWFNPMAWVMYILFNRDMELSCDETVIRKFGEGSKKAYAHMLISMEEKKSGLIPLYSNFSKNAIEERITAIMKLRKNSLFAVLSGMILIVAVVLVFATSAAAQEGSDSIKDALIKIPGDEFTQEESQKLFSLWIDEYKEMSISEYQEMMWKMCDDEETMELIERFSNAELAFEIADSLEGEAISAFMDYFFYIYEPLTAESGKKSFGGCTTWSADEEYGKLLTDHAVFEYELFMTVLDEKNLTVGEYDRTRREAESILQSILQDRTLEELQNEAVMRDILDEKIAQMEKQLGNDMLKIKVEYFFQPLSMETVEEAKLHEQINEETEALWEETLKPYVPFGLDYIIDPHYDGSEISMYYQGQEVRGIVDETRNLWITEHTGISAYSPDAVELYAVYENGKLSGLRAATEEEMEEWDYWRNRNTDEGNNSTEPRHNPNATEEDYASLLALKTSDYQEMSLSDFNASILDWGNEDFYRMERIIEDVGRNDYQVELSEEERSFVSLTLILSNEENYCMIESLKKGEPEEDPVFDGGWISKATDDGFAWCSLYWQLSYSISDKDSITVLERDNCINGVRKDIQKFWNETSLDELVKMSEGEVAARLSNIAAKYSNSRIMIRIDEDMIQFESVDERDLILN